MITLTINGEPAEFEDGSTVTDAVATVLRASRGVAVAVDREVVPRSEWASTHLREGTSVEVLVAAAGG